MVRRAILLAVGSGVCLGPLALVSQSFVVLLAQGLPEALASWQPYVLAVLGAVGFTMAQSAYQAAPPAISLPIIDALEPVVSVLLAAVLFRQHLSVSAGSLALEAVGGLAAVAGVGTLSRSPFIRRVYEQQQRVKEADRSATDGSAPAAVAGAVE